MERDFLVGTTEDTDGFLVELHLTLGWSLSSLQFTRANDNPDVWRTSTSFDDATKAYPVATQFVPQPPRLDGVLRPALGQLRPETVSAIREVVANDTLVYGARTRTGPLAQHLSRILRGRATGEDLCLRPPLVPNPYNPVLWDRRGGQAHHPREAG